MGSGSSSEIFIIREEACDIDIDLKKYFQGSKGTPENSSARVGDVFTVTFLSASLKKLSKILDSICLGEQFFSPSFEVFKKIFEIFHLGKDFEIPINLFSKEGLRFFFLLRTINEVNFHNLPVLEFSARGTIQAEKRLEISCETLGSFDQILLEAKERLALPGVKEVLFLPGNSLHSSLINSREENRFESSLEIRVKEEFSLNRRIEVNFPSNLSDSFYFDLIKRENKIQKEKLERLRENKISDSFSQEAFFLGEISLNDYPYHMKKDLTLLLIDLLKILDQDSESGFAKEMVEGMLEQLKIVTEKND